MIIITLTSRLQRYNIKIRKLIDKLALTLKHMVQKQKTTPVKGCLIYTRVSTDRQAEEGYSLNEQEKTCQKLAQQKNLKVLGIYREEGASGTSATKRPKFQEMLAKCSEDPNVKAVIVIHTDRFSRNTLEHLTIKGLLKRYNVELISALQPMLDDSPEGSLMDVILAGMNEFYSKDLGRKAGKGMQQKVEEGWWPGSAPIGYVNAEGSEHHKRILVVDKSKSHYIVEAFKRFKTGSYSVKSLIDELYLEGFRSKNGKKPCVSVINRMLKNIYYTGKMYYKGKIYQGKHEPLIDMETYQAVQKILDSHNNGANRSRKHSFLLSGLLFCQECKNQMTGEKHVKKSGRMFHYYRCLGFKNKEKSCQQPFSPMKDIEKQLENWLHATQLSEKFLKGFRLALEEVITNQKNMTNKKIKVLENRKMALEQKMNKLEDMLLEDMINKKRYHTKYLPLKIELSQIEIQIAQVTNPQARLLHHDIDDIL
ncbi:MAG: recombinase family protein, partial [Asgard group archaeon]|nr:recombinase family protein [Asgard group archaeon]